jgi:hypothetical protein
MLGTERPDRELLDTDALVGHLVKPGSMYRLLADQREALFGGDLFADLFVAGRGRPSLPGSRVATVMVLQALHGYSDPEAIDALRFDLRWKVAAGTALDDEGFDPSSLVYWRRRLRNSDRPNRIFDVVADVIAQTGVLRGKKRRAVDSVVFDDAVATQDTVTLLIGAIRRVARVVPGATAVIGQLCTAHDYTDPGKPRIAWEDHDARDALVSALVNDALAVLAAFEGADGLDEQGAEALALLALVAGQDVEPAEGSDGTDGRWKIAQRVAKDRIISTIDPETRHVHKTVSKKQNGYKGHLVIEPDTGLFTHGRITRASGEDNHEATVATEQLIPAPAADTATTDETPLPEVTDVEVTDVEVTTTPATDMSAGTGTSPADDVPVDPDPRATGGQTSGATTEGGDGEPTTDEAGTTDPTGTADGQERFEVLGDSAYGTADARAKWLAAGHDLISRPVPPRPSVPGGFTVDDFDVDEHAGTMTCPNGVVRPIRPNRQVTFGAACKDCPLRARCTKSKTGRGFTLHPRDALLRQARREWAADEARRATYRQHRPMVERSISWLIGQGRHRRLRYLGVTRNDQWLHTRMAAVNLKRLLTLGLVHADSGWAVAGA